jgi:S-adenosylmethionine:tRNA ribosyltransferase-isomerase
MRVDQFDFDLPEDRIALRPAVPRESARLLRVDPYAEPADCGGPLASLTDHMVGNLPELLQPGDALVFNDTRVIPAALAATRTRDGVTANVDFNLIKRVDDRSWRAFARPAKKLRPGDTLSFIASGQAVSPLSATVVDKLDAGEVELRFALTGPDLEAAIASVGAMPLPPYIALKRAPDVADVTDYQTIFAARDGAVAAPTAALHFTPELLDRLAQRGITRHLVTLHVGAGTFLPVKVDDTTDHKMHAEWGEVSVATAGALNAVRARGGRVVAVGTTPLRILESSAQETGQIAPFSGDTSIFITPGYRFRAVDALITNFHLPRSTLFMLVAAFSGLDIMRNAYAHAIANGYRFYSYGDASLLTPTTSAAPPRPCPGP